MGALEKAGQWRILPAATREALDGVGDGNVTESLLAVAELGQGHGGMVAGEAESEVSSPVVLTVQEMDPRRLPAGFDYPLSRPAMKKWNGIPKCKMRRRDPRHSRPI